MFFDFVKNGSSNGDYSVEISDSDGRRASFSVSGPEPKIRIFRFYVI